MQSLSGRASAAAPPASRRISSGRPQLTQCHGTRTRTRAAVELAQLSSSILSAVETVASAAPQPLDTAIRVVGGDLSQVAALSPTPDGIARLSVSAALDRRGPRVSPAPSASAPAAPPLPQCSARTALPSSCLLDHAAPAAPPPRGAPAAPMRAANRCCALALPHNPARPTPKTK